MKRDIIFKYTLHLTTEQRLYLPRRAKVLSAMEQHGCIVLYAHVNRSVADGPVSDQEEYAVYIIGTGNPASFLPDDSRFVDTVSMNDGALMCHVFVRKEAHHDPTGSD